MRKALLLLSGYPTGVVLEALAWGLARWNSTVSTSLEGSRNVNKSARFTAPSQTKPISMVHFLFSTCNTL